MSNKYEIWIEGYQATVDNNVAQCLARDQVANSFKEACVNFAKTTTVKQYGTYNEKNNSFWGCRLFDNETDARKSFG